MSIVIAIDGPAASGKGTLARKIAEELNLAHMDTGALYRAVGYEVLQSGGDPEDETTALIATDTLKNKLEKQGASEILGLEALKSDETGQAASKVAAIQSVRDALLDLQRDFAASPGERYKGAILDGRDIGTVIAPAADVKIFVTASIETRAERRTKELQSKDLGVTYEAVLKDMHERDTRDTARTAAPMIQAPDAITLDTSALNPAEMLDQALKIIRNKVQI